MPVPESLSETPPKPSIQTPKNPVEIPVLVVPTEVGGRQGLDPTRYGDWEKNGRCIDF